MIFNCVDSDGIVLLRNMTHGLSGNGRSIMENFIGELELGVTDEGKAGGGVGEEGVRLIMGVHAAADIWCEGEGVRRIKVSRIWVRVGRRSIFVIGGRLRWRGVELEDGNGVRRRI